MIGKSSCKSLLVSIFVAALAPSAAWASHGNHNNNSDSSLSSTSTQNSSYTPSDYGTPSGIGVGIERIVTSDNEGINMLHGIFSLGSQFALGIGLGFESDFNRVAFGPDLRYTIYSHGASQLFGMYNAYFLHGAGVQAGNGMGMGILVGFDYGLTSYLRMSFAYGFEIGVGSAFGSHFSVTNSDFVGNFGLHWYL